MPTDAMGACRGREKERKNNSSWVKILRLKKKKSRKCAVVLRLRVNWIPVTGDFTVYTSIFYIKITGNI